MNPQQLSNFFQAVDVDRSGRINAAELQQVLQSSNGRKFNENACRLMIGLFAGKETSIDQNQFSQLYTYVTQWLNTFRQFDANGSGFIDPGELSQALVTMGYRFGQGFIGFLMQRFGEPQGLPVDNFITVCILIHKFTEGFKKKDVSMTGNIQINYEDFLELVLSIY